MVLAVVLGATGCVDVAPVETLDATVRNPAKPDQFGHYTFDGDWLSDPRPVMVPALDELDAQAFAISDVRALSRVERRDDANVGHRDEGADGVGDVLSGRDPVSFTRCSAAVPSASVRLSH